MSRESIKNNVTSFGRKVVDCIVKHVCVDWGRGRDVPGNYSPEGLTCGLWPGGGWGREKTAMAFQCESTPCERNYRHQRESDVFYIVCNLNSL